MEYPYFLDPQRHRLATYYQWLNISGFVLMPFVYLLNELYIRPKLEIYRAFPDAVDSIFFLLINASLSQINAASLYVVMLSIAATFSLTYFFLPKWGIRPIRISMKSGLPKYNEYGFCYFYMQNRANAFAHWVWHYFLMIISFVVAVLLPSFFINTFRGSL